MCAERTSRAAMFLSSGDPDMYDGAKFSYDGDFLGYLGCYIGHSYVFLQRGRIAVQYSDNLF